MRVKVTDIRWDTISSEEDDYSEIALPSEVELTLHDGITDPNEIEEFIDEKLSKNWDFCVFGFEWEWM